MHYANLSKSHMSSQREKDDTQTTKELPQELRTRVADHLEAHAEFIEHASTERHIELIKDVEEELTVIRSVADQHQAIVRRIATEIKTPKASIDDYRMFGKIFATTAVERRLSLRDAIDGILFLKSEMLRELADRGFLLEMSSMELMSLMDFIGTRIDVLFAELAISYHRNFTEHLESDLALRAKQNRQKDLFIRIASHEIRNPLASALALCEIAELNGGDVPGTENETQKTFATIRADLRLINRHLNQLLAMSLLEDDKIVLKKERIDVSELLQGIKRAFERIRADREITLLDSPSIHIETDHDKLNQIISNLVQNAAKYSSPGTGIELSLAQKGTDCVISVTDHGYGIKEEETERIFDPYARLARDKDKVEGLGLGLYICRTLAQALGGSLTVESTLGVGSTFSLSLPIDQGTEISEKNI